MEILNRFTNNEVQDIKTEIQIIPFSPPDISQVEIDEVVTALKSGWITTGPKTKLFEQKLSQYCSTNKTVTTSSATAAMEMTLRYLGIGEGDEVITTAYTYTASASVINHVNAKIVMVDSGKGSFEIDYDQIADAITEKTKAIIAVDIAGVMCDYEKIFEIVNAKKAMFKPNNDIQEKMNRIAIIADAAHSFGATRQGRASGEFADFTCFSFHAVKNLTTGEGGAVTWNTIAGIDDEDTYTHISRLTLHGQSKDALAKTKLGSWEYDILTTGYKANMTDLMAAIGLGQLTRYADMLVKRKNIIKMYEEGFKNLDIQILQHYSETSQSSGHLFMMRLLGKDEEFRNAFIQKLAANGIASNVHYKPLPMLTAYKKLGFDIKDYPNAFDMYKNEVTLPLHTSLTESQVQYIIHVINELLS